MIYKYILFYFNGRILFFIDTKLKEINFKFDFSGEDENNAFLSESQQNP